MKRLGKELLNPNSKFSMKEESRDYIRKLIGIHRNNQVTVAWQGGERMEALGKQDKVEIESQEISEMPLRAGEHL